MFNKIKNEILIYQRTRNYINIVETTHVCKVYIYFEQEPWKCQDNRILKLNQWVDLLQIRQLKKMTWKIDQKKSRIKHRK